MLRTKSLLLCEWGPDGAVLCDVAVGRTLTLRGLVRLDPWAVSEMGMAGALRAAVAEHKWSGRSTIVLYAGGRSEHHIIDTPPGSSAETAVLVERLLAEVLTSPITGYIRRTLLLGATTVEARPRLAFLTALLPVDEAELVGRAITEAGLTLASIITLPPILAAVSQAAPTPEPTAFVHLDRGAGTVVYLQDGRVLDQADFRYGGAPEEEGGAAPPAEPATIAAEVRRNLDAFMQGGVGRPLARVALTGWEATGEVFDALASAGLPVDTVMAPPVTLGPVLAGTEGMDSFTYAHALLLWCATVRRVPGSAAGIDLAPRALVRPARLRRLVGWAAGAAAVYAVLLTSSGLVAARQRRGLEAQIADTETQKALFAADPKLERSQAEGRRRLGLVGDLHAASPDVGPFLAALSVAAGEHTVIADIDVARKGGGHHALVRGQSLGHDAAAAQSEFDRFVAALRRGRPAGTVAVGELHLENEHADPAQSGVGLKFEVNVTMTDKT